MMSEQVGALAALSRRDLLRCGAGALATVGAPRIVRAAGTGRALKMSYLFLQDSQLGAGADEFARKAESATNGAWRIDQYPGGAFGGELEMIDALRKGELDLAFVTGAVFANVAPDFGVLDLPFLFRNAAHAHAVLDGPIGRTMLDKFRQHDLMALAWGENGMRHITNSLRPIHAPEDLRGLKMRVPQSDVMLRCFRQLGVDTAPMAFPALYGALESGRFDGQENPIAVIRAAELDRVQQYLTLTGHIYSNAVIFISKDAWNGLSARERGIFLEAAHAGGMASRQRAGRDDREGVDVLRKTGMNVVSLVDRMAFRAALEPTWSKFATEFGPKLVSRIEAVPAATETRG